MPGSAGASNLSKEIDPAAAPPSAQALVSVVIPCFRQAHFLPEAIESVLRQTYRNVEVVVVDDGSPDDVAEVVSRYAEVRYVRQENRGQAAARNTGFRATRGDVIVFLDSDDRLLPEAVEVGVRRLVQHSECAFVFGHSTYITADGTPLRTPLRPRIDEDHYLSLLEKGNFIRTPAVVVFRRWILERIGGFDESLRGAEDYDLYMRIARSVPIRGHMEIVAERRTHSGSSTSRPTKRLPSAIAARRRQLPHVKLRPEYHRAYRKGLHAWAEEYATNVAAELLVNIRTRRWWEAGAGFWMMIRYPLLLRYVLQRLLSWMCVRPRKR